MSGYGNQVEKITSSGDSAIDGVTFGIKWQGSITYAFPSSASQYGYTYESQKNFATTTVGQQAAALFVLEVSDGKAANDGFSVEGFTAVDISAGDPAAATIRFAQSDAPTTAYAYMPGSYDQAGDLWFGRNYNYTDAQAGNYAWHSILHETGHALGLKHGHEVQNGFAALPAEYDSIEYSVMTYRSYEGGAAASYSYGAWSAPQTFMMLDIAALQKMYGADFTTNSGDTVYKWTPASGDTLVDGEVGIDAGGTVIFATIWDGGGYDVYDLSAYSTDLVIDLSAGGASSFGSSQLASLGSGHKASGSIYNALMFEGDRRSLIEAATGGAGSDRISGNQIANVLVGLAGDDEILGGSGADHLDGGDGNDRLFGGRGQDKLFGGFGDDILSGGARKDVFRFTFANGNDIVSDFAHGQDKLAFKGFIYTDAEDLLSNAVQSGDDVVFRFDSENSVTLQQVELGLLTADDFKFTI